MKAELHHFTCVVVNSEGKLVKGCGKRHSFFVRALNCFMPPSPGHTLEIRRVCPTHREEHAVATFEPDFSDPLAPSGRWKHIRGWTMANHHDCRY